jgi:hypothetical protein
MVSTSTIFFCGAPWQNWKVCILIPRSHRGMKSSGCRVNELAATRNLYDSILSTCADPNHLSVVAALADPLPMPQSRHFLALAWAGILRQYSCRCGLSWMSLPTTVFLRISIARLFVTTFSDPSNYNLPQVHIPSPHSLLTASSFYLIMKEIPEKMAFWCALGIEETQSNHATSRPPEIKRLVGVPRSAA